MVAMSVPQCTGGLAAAAAGGDWAILAGVVFLTLVAVLLAVAETALTRVSKSQAQALAETRGKRGEILLSLVEHQEWLHPTLFVPLARQLVQSPLPAVPATRLLGAWAGPAPPVPTVPILFGFAAVSPTPRLPPHT